MSPDKKEIILQEIEQWRSGRLLPEQYCDFLENLYKDEQERNSPSLSSLRQGNFLPRMLLFGIFVFIFFSGFYFSLFPWVLQMAITLLLTSLFYTVASVWRRTSKRYANITALTGSLLLLGFGAWMLRLQGWEGREAHVLLIAACAVCWTAAGFFMRLPFLHYCGLACGILLYAYMFASLHPGSSWEVLQLLWLPLCVLLIWFSWFCYHRIKGTAAVYFATGATVWFMPEADAYLLRHAVPSFFIWLCLGKLVMAFILLFVFRKKWIVWVSS